MLSLSRSSGGRRGNKVLFCESNYGKMGVGGSREEKEEMGCISGGGGGKRHCGEKWGLRKKKTVFRVGCSGGEGRRLVASSSAEMGLFLSQNLKKVFLLWSVVLNCRSRPKIQIPSSFPPSGQTDRNPQRGGGIESRRRSWTSFKRSGPEFVLRGKTVSRGCATILSVSPDGSFFVCVWGIPRLEMEMEMGGREEKSLIMSEAAAVK